MLEIILFSAFQPENPDLNNVVSYPSVTSLFFRIIFTLVFVIVLTYIILRIIKRQQNLQQNQKKWINILDYQALGSNRGLYLMDLYGLICIVAVSDGQISILKEIDPDTEKWENVKNSLLETENFLTKGIGKSLLRIKDISINNEKTLSKDKFPQYLSEQLRKNKYLSHDIFQGRDKDE